ncbi:unnamed protein product [Paramecium pentaurelia]|uniref:Uncharacterized protein n=1 Tax=Paramecium pentaurelia TaxID=43138 RepID=A0A8S1TG09_9CILI|nr:unnamed protein product [Paramecium pentaurelia]
MVVDQTKRNPFPYFRSHQNPCHYFQYQTVNPLHRRLVPQEHVLKLIQRNFNSKHYLMIYDKQFFIYKIMSSSRFYTIHLDLMLLLAVVLNEHFHQIELPFFNYQKNYQIFNIKLMKTKLLKKSLSKIKLR